MTYMSAWRLGNRRRLRQGWIVLSEISVRVAVTNGNVGIGDGKVFASGMAAVIIIRSTVHFELRCRKDESSRLDGID